MKILRCFERSLKVYIDKNDWCAISTDQETTPEKVWDLLFLLMDFIKNKTSDIFPFNKKWTRYHHCCGFIRKISAKDIYINSKWSEEGAALSILKAFKLFFEGANVGLLIPENSFEGSTHKDTLERFGKVVDLWRIAFGDHKRPPKWKSILICLR